MSFCDWLDPGATRIRRTIAGWANYMLCHEIASKGPFILDIGAGQQEHARYFKSARYCALDRYGKSTICADASRIPLQTNSVDAVLCTEVLEHVPNPAQVISEIGRVLKPGGKFLITAPQVSGAHAAPQHFYAGFSQDFYSYFCNAAGLLIQHCEPNGGFWLLYGQETIRGLTMLLGPLRWLSWPLRPVIMGVCYLLHRWQPRPEFAFGYVVEGRKL